MKPITRLFTTLSLIFLLTGCASLGQAGRPPLEASSAQESVFVQAPDGTYSVRVPAGWQLQDSGSPGPGLQLVSGNDARQGLMIVRSFPTSIAPTPGALGQVQEGVIEGLREQTHDFVLESERAIAVEQHAGFQVRYRCAFLGVPVKGALTVLADRNGLYSVNMVAPRARFAHAEIALGRLLSSFKALDVTHRMAERGGHSATHSLGGVFGPSDGDAGITVAGR